MSRVLYIDAFAGLSGDMLLAGLIDLGLDEAWLSAELSRLPIEETRLLSARVIDRGLSACRLEVETGDARRLRHLPDILAIIEQAGYSPWVTTMAGQAFRRLAQAEARVHGTTVDEVHFHEVGAVDTIIDVVGFFLALERLGIEEVICSPLPMPRGRIEIAHGTYPLPAPAVVFLLAGIPVYGVSDNYEMVTPTGAALVAVAAQGFGEWPAMVVEGAGFGAGQPGKGSMPNVVRLILGTREDVADETVVVLETQIDDMNPEVFSYLGQRLLAQGALDYYMTPVYMKKSRPGVLLTVLSPPPRAASLAAVIMTETTTSGVRRQTMGRWVLRRRQETATTAWGDVRMKVFSLPGGGVRPAPEYDDCARLAAEAGVPLQAVFQAALEAWGEGSESGRHRFGPVNIEGVAPGAAAGMARDAAGGHAHGEGPGHPHGSRHGHHHD